METLVETSLVLWSAPIYLVLIGSEVLISNWKQRPAYTWRDTLENVYLCALNSSIDLFTRGFSIVVLAFFASHQLTQIENPVVYWIGLVIGLDFLFYWLHRVDHVSRFFWAIHVTHHSSTEFNLTVGFRSSVFQPMYRFFYFIPLAWLFFKPLDILFVYSATQIYGILLHTKGIRKLGPLEWIFATPSHHRVHHGSNPEYLDKNMGMVLIIWDRLFGTFQKEYAKVRYGTTKMLVDHSPSNVVFHEWKDLIREARACATWKERFSVVFGAPGRKYS